MTIYEHIMLGVDVAMAANLHRRYGWRIVAWAGCAAALPDWDGLTLLAGGKSYDAGHRVWGHNVLVAGLVAVALSVVAWVWARWRASREHAAQGRMALEAESPELTDVDVPALAKRSDPPLLVWCLVGLLGSYSHLAMDLLFSSGGNHETWGVLLLWPFSRRDWAFPMVPWGDVGTTLVFAAGMLATARFHSRSRSIAVATLILVAIYIVIRGMLLNHYC